MYNYYILYNHGRGLLLCCAKDRKIDFYKKCNHDPVEITEKLAKFLHFRSHTDFEETPEEAWESRHTFACGWEHGRDILSVIKE